jgi:opacity protein-like surface antigen
MINKLLLFLFGTFLLIGNPAFSQKRKPLTGRKAEFLQKQWYVGIRGGMNLTKADPVQRYSVFSSTNGSDMYNKTYQNFKQPGASTGIEVTFYYHGISASFQPNYRRQRFIYTNDYEWEDASNPSNSLTLHYEQDHHLDYFDLPILVKYDILKNAIKPFVQVGYYYSILNSATKSVTISGTDNASGGTNFNQPPIIVGAKDLFIKSSMGFILGAGVSYDIGNIKLILDINYRLGTNNITNRKNRFTNNHLAGSGDAMDDIKLRSINFNLGCLFPLRFLNVSHYRAN